MKITNEYLDTFKTTFHVVIKGKKTGIYPDWESASEQVIGFSKCTYLKKANRFDAVIVLIEGLTDRSKDEELDYFERETLTSCIALGYHNRKPFPSLI